MLTVGWKSTWIVDGKEVITEKEFYGYDIEDIHGQISEYVQYRMDRTEDTMISNELTRINTS